MLTILAFLASLIAVVGVIGWLWIVVLAFSKGDTTWGVGCLLLPPLSIFYGLMNYQDAKIPLWIVTIGFGINIAIRIIGAIVGMVMAAST